MSGPPSSKRPRILLVDDAPEKWNLVYAAMHKFHQSVRPEVHWADTAAALEIVPRATDGKKTVLIPDLGTSLTAQELAQYDLFLIDFALNLPRYGYYGPEVSLRLPSGSIGELSCEPSAAARQFKDVKINLTTGLGVALYLSQRFKDEDYLQARGARVLPKVCMFGDIIDEHSARIGAALAHICFGSMVAPTGRREIVRLAYLVHRLLAEVAPENHPAWAPPSSDALHQGAELSRRYLAQEELLATGSDVLGELLFPYRGGFPEKREWIAQPDGLSGYLWLRSFLASRGSGVNLDYRRDGLIAPARFPRKPTRWPNTKNQLFDDKIASMYADLKRFEGAFQEADLRGWPLTLEERRSIPEEPDFDHVEYSARVRRTMFDILDQSRIAWQERPSFLSSEIPFVNDVECALRWYLAQPPRED